MGEKTETKLIGDVEEDTVLFADSQLVIWAFLMYSLGVFTGLGIMTAVL